MTFCLSPLARRARRSIEAQLIGSQISFQMQPRVFDERFPRMVLYINDVLASGTQWHGVFLAETGGEGGFRLTPWGKASLISQPKQSKLAAHPKGGDPPEFFRGEADHHPLPPLQPNSPPTP